MISTTATATTATNRMRKPIRKKRNGLFCAGEGASVCKAGVLSAGSAEGTVVCGAEEGIGVSVAGTGDGSVGEGSAGVVTAPSALMDGSGVISQSGIFSNEVRSLPFAAMIVSANS